MADNKKHKGLFGLGKKSVPAEAIKKAPARPYYAPWYDFTFASDGVYLRCYYNTGVNSPLKADLIRYDLMRRGVEDVEINGLQEAMYAGEVRFRVAPAQAEKPCDGGVYVLATRDEMSASMQLLPPNLTGRVLTADEVFDKVKREHGIVYGIDEQAVAAAAESGIYFEPVLIAQGNPARVGEDAQLHYLLHTGTAGKSESTALPEYKEEEFFSIVHPGDIIATKTPRTEGEEGITVRGMRLPPVGGRESRLYEGRGMKLSPDGMTLYANKEGRLYLVGNRLVISDVLIVRGDVGPLTGDIDYDGDVLIGGGVQSGVVVRATGNIEIAGPVEAAAIDAGRDLVLYQGIQGADSGVLHAGGNLYAHYIIRSSADTDGNLYGDYIVSSQISVMGMVRMMGSHAKIFGGMVRASSRVWVTSVGTVSGEKTTIEIGPSPKLHKILAELEEKRIQTKAQLDKIDNLTRIPVSRNETPERMEMRRKLLSSRDMVIISLDGIIAEIDAIKAEIRKRSDGRLHVRGEISPDVKISIDGIAFLTRTRGFNSTYKCRDGILIASSYEGDTDDC